MANNRVLFAFNSFFLASFCLAVLEGMGPSVPALADAIAAAVVSSTSSRNSYTQQYKLEKPLFPTLNFSNDSKNNPNPKTVVSAGGRNITFDHAIFMDKFEALATKINFEFLIIRNELKEMRDGHRDNYALQIYMKDDTPIHEIVYKPPSIQNENDKGDVSFIEEDEIEPIPAMPNPNQIYSNSPTVLPFLKDCTVYIPYMIAKTFTDDVLLNHVGDKEVKSSNGVGTGKMIKKEKNDRGMPKEPNKEWKLNEKMQVMKEDAWRRSRLISQAYASFCVAFITWSSIAITLPGELRFS
ncbi:hypothetical protein Tco_0852808 [Tanacetum coccineum]